MSDWIYPPLHTSVEIAARLRKELDHKAELKADAEVRRNRVGERFQARIDQEPSPLEQERIRSEWAYRNQEFRIEIASCEAAHAELRKLLQWLTGELWS